MKNFLTFGWVGLAVLTLVGGIANIAVMAGTDTGLMSGLAMRGLYLITLPMTLITTGLIYRFILDRTVSTGVGVVGIIHLVLALIGTLFSIAGWYYQALAMSGAQDNFQLMGILFGVSGVFSLLSAVFFLVAILIALNTRSPEAVSEIYS